MAILSQTKINMTAVNEGEWVSVLEETGDAFEIKSRGLTDKWQDARAAAFHKAALPFQGDESKIPISIRRKINADLLKRHLLVDIRGLWHDETKQKPVTIDEFKEVLGDPAFDRLQGACFEAASKVQEAANQNREDVLGN